MTRYNYIIICKNATYLSRCCTANSDYKNDKSQKIRGPQGLHKNNCFAEYVTQNNCSVHTVEAYYAKAEGRRYG